MTVAANKPPSKGLRLSASKTPLPLQFVFFAIALLLTFTGIAKLLMLISDPFADIKVGMPSLILWIVIGVEFSVVFLIFSKEVSQSFKLMTLVGMHFVFLIVSLGRYMLGFKSCGCAGAIELHPLAMIFVNLLILGLLIVVGSNIWSGPKSVSRKALGTIGGFILAFAIFAMLRGINENGLPFISSSVQAHTSRDQAFVVGQETPINVTISNSSSLPIDVLGYKASCTCVSSEDPLINILPNEEQTISFVVTPKVDGFFWQRIRFFVSSSEQNVIEVDVVGMTQPELALVANID